jgi:O-antigen/teichoic acid export membrane protein
MATLFTGRTLAFAVTFVMPLVLVRVFSQEEYGLYKQLFLVHETLVSILTLGLVASLYYFVPNDPAHRRAYISNTLLALAVVGTIGLGALVALKAQVAWLLSNPRLQLYLPAMALFTGFCLVTSMLESLMVILKQVRLAALTGLVSDVLRAAMVIGAALWIREMGAVVMALLLWVGCRTITLIVYLRTLGIRPWREVHRERIRSQWHYSLPFGLALMVRTFADNLHQYAVAHLYGPVLFAVYSVGSLQVPVVSIAFESTADVALVRLTELRRDGRLDKSVELIRGTVATLSLLLLPLYVWLVANSGEFILLLYTRSFEASVPIFVVFLTIIPLTALGLDYVPRAFADTRFILRVNVYRLAVNVVLLIILWPMNLLGAALATVGAMMAAKLLILLRVRTLLNVSVAQLLPTRRLMAIAGASCLAGLAAWFARIAVSAGPPGDLVISAAVFGACYVSIAWTGGILNEAEKTRVRVLLASGSRLTRQTFSGHSR